MAAVTWGQLAKSLIDPKLIEERIAEIIAEHNEDETAHLGAGQSLQSHKASEIIDHLVGSILGEKLDISAQVGDCIVAAEGGDYTSIQAALDAGKKSIYVKGGTYEITSPITILSSGVTIKGESRVNTIIKTANGANCHAVVIGDGATVLNDIVIEDIQIDGNKANQTEIVNGIWLKGGSAANITFSSILNCYIHDCARYGIYLKYSENCIITGCQANSNYSRGIYLDRSHNNMVTANQANFSASYQGIYLDYSNKNAITGNQVVSNSTNHGMALNYSNNNTVTGNQISENYHGLNLSWSDNNVIIGNQINSNTGGRGIYLLTSHNNIISSNQTNSNATDGIRLEQSDYNTIIGNHSQENAGYGINIYNTQCDNNLVIKNYLTENTTGSLNDSGTGTILGASTTNDNVV